MDTMCPKHTDYDASEAPKNMCQFCWAAWDGEQVERKRREAEEAEVSKMVYVDLPDEVLRQLVLDICDDRVFTDRHCRKPDEVAMCFPILMFMKLCDRKFIAANPPGMIWEFMHKASPTGVNGLPMFFSCHFLSPADMDKVHPMVVAELTRRQEFVKVRIEETQAKILKG